MNSATQDDVAVIIFGDTKSSKVVDAAISAKNQAGQAGAAADFLKGEGEDLEWSSKSSTLYAVFSQKKGGDCHELTMACGAELILMGHSVQG